MSCRAIVLSIAVGLLVASAPIAAQHGRRSGPTQAASCGDAVGFQVLLDRNGFSPGEIDGSFGENAWRALTAFQAANDLPVTRALDCATWKALDGGAETTVRYTITDEDASGSFEPTIPTDLIKQADLPALAYRSSRERLAERFHMAPALLARLNRNARFEAGSSIIVAAVAPFDDRAKPTRNTSAHDTTLEVTRDNALRVLGADGHLLFMAPVTSGSEHDPLPLGQWKVTSVDWMPAFHYNPALFWDADASDTRTTIKPGPNNPVGVVWIGINIAHYGLHGTPEPSLIGHTQSHGCVRMTNWDAARVATLIAPGTPVVFK